MERGIRRYYGVAKLCARSTRRFLSQSWMVFRSMQSSSCAPSVDVVCAGRRWLGHSATARDNVGEMQDAYLTCGRRASADAVERDRRGHPTTFGMHARVGQIAAWGGPCAGPCCLSCAARRGEETVTGAKFVLVFLSGRFTVRWNVLIFREKTAHWDEDAESVGRRRQIQVTPKANLRLRMAPFLACRLWEPSVRGRERSVTLVGEMGTGISQDVCCQMWLG